MQQIRLKRETLNLYLKGIDFPFLFFLILILQGNIQLKVLGLLLISVIRVKAIFKANYLGVFYLLIIFYHLIYGFINIIIDYRYIPNFFLVLIFWTFSFLIISQIRFFLKKNTFKTISKTIDFFFLLSVIVVIIQYLNIVIDFQNFNPYSVTNSAGDYIKSIFSNSSINMLVMSFFALMYFMKKEWFKGVIAALIILMTTYMSGIAIFFFLLLLSSFFLVKIKIKVKVFFLLGSIILFYLFQNLSPGNLTYASRYINRILENGEDIPYKIKSFIQTKDYLFDSVKSFLFGAGGGNFSSRVAFIASGDYVDWYPRSLRYMSSEFSKNHYWIWNYDFNNPWDNINNTANQPFSFYNKIFGEYGFIGLMIFIFTYIYFFFKNRKFMSYSKFFLIIMLGYFVLDYWYEYFSVIIIFELLSMKDISENKKRKN